MFRPPPLIAADDELVVRANIDSLNPSMRQNKNGCYGRLAPVAINTLSLPRGFHFQHQSDTTPFFSDTGLQNPRKIGYYSLLGIQKND
jgi:hypothetical protein